MLVREAALNLRITQAELAAIRAHARASRQTVSEWTRRVLAAATAEPLPPPDPARVARAAKYGR